MSALAATYQHVIEAIETATNPAPFHICSTKHNRWGVRYVVLHRATGEYYRVGQLTLNRLREGSTPESLGLEPLDEDELRELGEIS